MPGQVLIAPHTANLEGPSIFLAGPIQGAARWQDDAIKLIREADTDVHITSPRRPVFEDTGFEYESQVDWETEYLDRAAKTGAILFWMADEHEHFCTRAYAQTTRYEYAEWLTNYLWQRRLGLTMRVKLAIGIDAHYSGQRYIRHRLKKDAPELLTEIRLSLRETCLHAVRLVRQV
jgi:hypothetical protein